MKLHSNVSLNETMCRIHDSATQTQGPDYSSRTRDLPLNFKAAPYISNPSNISLNFIQETMCRIHDTATQTQGNSHTSISRLSSFNSCLLHISPLFDWYTLSFTQMFLSGETICRTHDSATQTQMSRTQFNEMGFTIVVGAHSVSP